MADTLWPSHKSPRNAQRVTSEKQPRSLGIDHAEPWQRQPVWRFGDLDIEHPSAVGSLTPDDYAQVYKALGQYESQRCSEIWAQHDNGCKRYAVEDAHANITSRLTTLERDDETAVHTLRINGKFRVYGILREHVFYVLWIDREHEMWPSEKRNT
ncbi:hypothetical protein [Marmoricola sp. RAF53]|uniref:hypothetical protein n=1 Tax=Marmoricola sp. RAF53 TaxID=3233059 RepID=UPI003F9D1375